MLLARAWNLSLTWCSAKMSCFAEIDKKLADQRSAIDEHARVLNEVSESVVRDSGVVVGGLGVDPRAE